MCPALGMIATSVCGTRARNVASIAPKRLSAPRTNRTGADIAATQRVVELPGVDRLYVGEERGRIVDRLLRTTRHGSHEVGPPGAGDPAHPQLHRPARIARPRPCEWCHDGRAGRAGNALVDGVDRGLLQHERSHDSRRIERELQCHDTAPRVADDVRPLHPEVIEQRERIAHVHVDGGGAVAVVAAHEAAAVVADQAVVVGERGFDHQRCIRGRGARVHEQHRLAVFVAPDLVLETDGSEHRLDIGRQHEPEPLVKPHRAGRSASAARGATGVDGRRTAAAKAASDGSVITTFLHSADETRCERVRGLDRSRRRCGRAARPPREPRARRGTAA